jgi:hypothetical protein
MSSPRQDPRRTSRSLAHTELERRLVRACDELQRARSQLHHSHEAVLAAEEALLARRLAWEAAALHAAELADVVEILERDLARQWGPHGQDGTHAPGDTPSASVIACSVARSS